MSYAWYRRRPVNLRQSFKRARTVPLPDYEDASRLWHWHVGCLGCHPDTEDALRHTDAVPTRAEAFRLQAELNASIHGSDAGHHHVILGCGAQPCRIIPLSPD